MIKLSRVVWGGVLLLLFVGEAKSETMYRWRLSLSDVTVSKTKANGKPWDPGFWGKAPDLYFQIRLDGREWLSPVKRNRYKAFRQPWSLGGIEPKKLGKITIKLWDKDRLRYHDLVAETTLLGETSLSGEIRRPLASWRYRLDIVEMTDVAKKEEQDTARSGTQDQGSDNERVAHLRKGSIYALLIGVDRYKNKRDWSTLAYAEADIAGLYRVLTTKGRVPKKNVVRLLGKSATLDAVLARLHKMKRQAKAGDTVLLVVAGHGERKDGASYLALYDTSVSKLPSTGLHTPRLTQGWRTSRVVVMLDACHSGAGVEGVRSGQSEGRDVLKIDEEAFSGTGRVLVSSSRQSQKSYEDRALGHGFFSYAMMEALKGAADTNGDGVVTLIEAYVYASHRVKRLAKERKKKEQEPVFSGSLAGEIALSFPGKREEQKLEPVKMLPLSAKQQEPSAKQHTQINQHRAGDRKVERFQTIDFAMRWVPSGFFWMGSQRETDEQPRRCTSVTRGYWMLETEVTQRQFAVLTGRWPSQFVDCKKKDCPVERVSWHEAAQFANLLSKKQDLPRCFVCDQKTGQCRGVSDYIGCKGWRLPTEAEWEHAAHARPFDGRCQVVGDSTPMASLEEWAWFVKNSGTRQGADGAFDCTSKRRNGTDLRCGTHPVAQKRANLWGLYDMLGNVSEWVYDTYKENAYREDRKIDPLIRGSSIQRIHRGGSWRSPAKEVTKTYRQSGAAGWRSFFVGFRLIRVE